MFPVLWKYWWQVPHIWPLGVAWVTWHKIPQLKHFGFELCDADISAKEVHTSMVSLLAKSCLGFLALSTAHLVANDTVFQNKPSAHDFSFWRQEAILVERKHAARLKPKHTLNRSKLVKTTTSLPIKTYPKYVQVFRVFWCVYQYSEHFWSIAPKFGLIYTHYTVGRPKFSGILDTLFFVFNLMRES